MGLLDGYFDPQQFQASGGLLGRLLSLPEMQGLYRRGAEDLDRGSTAPAAPSPLPPPWPGLSSGGQPSSDGQPAAPDIHSHYQALRPMLGDHDAMLATVHPERGNALIAQALANQQPGGSANAVAAGYGGPVISDASPDPVKPGSQFAQGPLLCAAGPGGCAIGGGITLGQAIFGGAAALLGGATILNNQKKPPAPRDKPSSSPTGKTSSGTSVVPGIDQSVDGGSLVEGGDRKNPCRDRWEAEYNSCDRFGRPNTSRFKQACQARANDRLHLCYQNGGIPDPDEPPEYSWKDIARDRQRR